ncbi:MAG: hypothetical protein R3C68_05010 [Myxococcota bacterium]
MARRPARPCVIERIEIANVSATVLQVVADKTGYPSDMLNLSMGLDADSWRY